VPNILDLVQRECERAGLPLPAAQDAGRVYKRLCSSVPAEGVRKRGMGDIVNGGWMALLDPELWPDSDHKFRAINELVFKSLDVMEFEERINAPEVGRTGRANPNAPA
jgi:hypothetical protein